MNEQMKRLYEAARQLKGIEGPSALARALNKSPQLIRQWEVRGISKDGFFIAESKIGCSATWLATGTGVMTPASISPYRNNLINVAKAIGTTPEDILDGDETAKPDIGGSYVIADQQPPYVRALDQAQTSLMLRVIEAAENEIARIESVIPPAKKAKLIVAAYDFLIKESEHNEKTVRDAIMKLVELVI